MFCRCCIIVGLSSMLMMFDKNRNFSLINYLIEKRHINKDFNFFINFTFIRWLDGNWFRIKSIGIKFIKKHNNKNNNNDKNRIVFSWE